MSDILNPCFTLEIQFRDILHGFGAGCGTGTTARKAKIIQYIITMRKVILYEIFLDLQKLYDALYWDMCLEIVAAYGVGTMALQLLQTYWGCITMVYKSKVYYGPPSRDSAG